MALRQTGDASPRKVSIPSLTGMTRTQAQAALTAAGLSYSETNENTGDSGLDTKVKTGTQTTGTVLLGTTVTYTYYTYVYGGFYHGFSHYGGFYHGFYHSFYHGFYHGFAFGGYGLNVSSSPWIGVNMNVRSVDGYVIPINLEPQTIIETRQIAELKDLSDPTELKSETLTILHSSSMVLEVTQSVGDTLYVINGNHYSPNYYALAKKDGIYSFVNVADIDDTYMVYSASANDFISVELVEKIAYIDNIYTINAQPINLVIVNDLLVFDKPVE
jgi:hypothetical protein